MVWTTASLPVSMTETVSLLVLATNSALPALYSAVGCRPTSIDWTRRTEAAVSMTLTVPVVVVSR